MLEVEITTDAVLNDPQFRVFKKFCNDLRCPLCNSQLDGSIHPKEARLYCVSNNDEYVVIYSNTKMYLDTIPSHEMFMFLYSQYQYVINIEKLSNELFNTSIDRLDLNLRSEIRYHEGEILLEYSGAKIPYFSQKWMKQLSLRKFRLAMFFADRHSHI